ncbi:hypothetical protein OBBRIDRAFT_384790 [Obba rivulosa]|uniref:Uncharacterized protein n=1 Tax=Obba rivulosa TaxID=1052685 RepID=A0A8E2DFC5_9APHY|nr:hypothetical protein OBBRIDRAFT_384790 [Obba rivulosa]
MVYCLLMKTQNPRIFVIFLWPTSNAAHVLRSSVGCSQYRDYHPKYKTPHNGTYVGLLSWGREDVYTGLQIDNAQPKVLIPFMSARSDQEDWTARPITSPRVSSDAPIDICGMATTSWSKVAS